MDAFGQIYDEAISEDPIMVLPAGEVSSEPFTVEICGSDSRLTIVLGSDLAQGEECDLSLMVETPAGNLVDLNDSAVETNDGKGWYFVRIPLPYQGEHTGTWTARAVRPQRVFTHGFATDAFVLLEEGVDLVREEIHRLCPTGCESVLYFEDGSATGTSAYAAALERELAAGTINLLEQSFSPEQFNDRLLGDWELIVFARQIDPTAQIYDDRLLKKLCKEEQKALITDFWRPVGFPNPIFECVGVSVGQQVNWNLIIGDGRLLTGVIPLFNPGYEVYSFSIAALPGPWLVQATNEVSGGSVVGTGTGCDSQTFFMSSLVRGFGRVEPYFVRPRTIVGQGILATFRMTESNRPIGNWDAVAATVTLERPGGGPPETYSLFDDGTNGDRAAGNNYWSREIPLVATEPGPHLLRATFFLTKDGCMIRREAEGTIMVQPEPEECLHVAGHDRLIGRRGQTVNVGTTCVQNRCLQPATYVVTVTDTQGWLCTVDEETGEFIPLAEATVATDSLEVGFGECLLETLPLLICIPPEAHLAEFTEVRYETYDVAGTLLATTSTIVQVDTGVDCNGNGLADTIDIAAGTSEDLNRNGIPDECAGDVCPTEGSCCVSNGTAGCEVLECCIEVCAADPFCCDVLWDPACAALGNQCSDCETVCGTPAMCDGDVNGDGAVDPLDAGAILARFGLDSCEEDVCQYDVNCDGAINPLDSGYVLARFGTCDPVAACALSFCPPPVPPTGACCTDGVCSEGTPSDCVYDGIYQGDGTDCAGTDCGDTEACCFIDGTCEDLDPGTCIDLGGGNQGAETTCAGGGCEGSACPTSASGDCCDPLGNGTPGCDDPTCCDAVCSIDPFCCDVAWDTLCAAQAQELCPICGGP